MKISYFAQFAQNYAVRVSEIVRKSLSVNQRRLKDLLFALRFLGDIATTVQVAGEAPRLDAVSATLGRVVENRSLQSMPLTSRSAR